MALSHEHSSNVEARTMGNSLRTLHSYPEGKAVVYDTSPVHPSGLPVLLGHGFGVLEHVEAREKAALEDGIRLIAPFVDVTLSAGEKTEGQDPDYNLTSAEIYARVLTDKGVNFANGVGISAGALRTALSAVHFGKLKKVVLINPGLIPQRPSKLIYKWARDKYKGSRNNRNRLKNTSTGDAVVDFARYVKRNPLGRLREIQGIAESDLLDVIYQGRERGITFSAIVAEGDQIFEYDGIKAAIEEKRRQGFPFPFEHFEVVQGGHEEPLDNPVRTRMAFQMLKA